VANYFGVVVEQLIKIDSENEYGFVLLLDEKEFQFSIFNFQSNNNVSIKQFKFPPHYWICFGISCYYAD